ncbi:MAG: ISL3 family transposase [Oleispira sp.]|nr:ISL3 family transposase [Oleispira sp.]
MDELSLYEHILSVSAPWFVEHIDLDKPTNTVHVYVQYDPDISLECPSCARQVTRYDSRKRSWRHLDTCQFQTIVHCDVPRSDCPEHGALLVEVPWAEKGGRYTLMFEALVIDWLKEASINAVSRRLSLSWNAIDGIMQRAVKRGLDRRSDMDTSHLAVDEVNRKKGHKYMTIISNDRGYVLDVQEGKGKEGLSLYFQGLSLLTRTNIKTISMDLSPAFRAVALEYIPDAKNKICFDKFHIAQDLNKAVDAVRKHEIKNIEAKWRQPLHLSRFAWLRNKKTLTTKHQEKIDSLLSVAVKTARAWAIRQYAMTLWNYKYAKSAKKAWAKWYSWAIRSRLTPIVTMAKSIKRHLWGIINAIIYKKSNGGAESINAKIKTLKVRAKGFRSVERFKVAILFHLGGLDLKPNPH